ncbi:MAG: hypothetical protein QW703_01535 [Candidatus Aenigmatarchaeota archaeon]
MKKLIYAGLIFALLSLTGCKEREKSYWDYLQARNYKEALEYLIRNKDWIEAIRHARLYNISNKLDKIGEACWNDLVKEDGFADAVNAYICANEFDKELAAQAEERVYRLAEDVKNPAELFIASRKLDYFGLKNASQNLEQITNLRFGELEFRSIKNKKEKGCKWIAVKGDYYFDDENGGWQEIKPDLLGP